MEKKRKKKDKKKKKEKKEENKEEKVELKNDEEKLENKEEEEVIVNPWEVKGEVDYDKLLNQFGAEKITEELIERFEKLTKKPVHPWIKRGLFFCHRDLNLILDAYEKKENFFLYTGRGPTSDALHIGHLIPFLFTKWLQDVLDCYLVIQISDDEKFYFKNNKFQEIYKLGFENAKDIIAIGFNPQKTFIFSNRDYRLSTPEYEELVAEINKKMSFHILTKVFGFTDQSNVGMVSWPSYQIAASFSCAYPHLFRKKSLCLIPYAIDQDPYFRLSRDIQKKLKQPLACSIMGKFIPPLTGIHQGKMSSSLNQQTTIFLTDDPKTIKMKINKYSFSGGGGDGTLEQHKKFGGNVEKDIPCQYLKFFELDDSKLNDILTKFSKGELSCGDTKNALIEKLTELIIGHQKKRAEVNDDIVNLFYAKDKSVYKKIISPYEKDIPSFSYPAMVTTMRNIDIVKQNLTKQLNNLGTHTRTDKNYLDGFEETQNAEREYIYWIGKQLFKTSNDIKNDIDGYLSSGNDESNIMGLWILRNMIKDKGESLENIHVIYSKLSNSSIIKACNILNIHNKHCINIDKKQRIDYDEVVKKCEEIIGNNEKNKIILFLSLGSSLSGTIDKIIKLNTFINEKFKDKIFIHIDASFGGFIIPFIESEKKYCFENENVLTIGLEAHKTGQLPYPTGIFLCRKNLQKYIEISSEELYSFNDDTLIGTRSGIPSLLSKWYVNNYGENGQKDFVNFLIKGTVSFIEVIKKDLSDFIELKPHSKKLNYFTFVFKNLSNENVEKIEKKLMLKSYTINEEKIYKIPVMPHTIKNVKKFVKIIKENSK